MILKIILYAVIILLTSCVVDNDPEGCLEYETMSDAYMLSIEYALAMHNIDYLKTYENGVNVITIDTCDIGFDIDQEILNTLNSPLNIKIRVDESMSVFKYMKDNDINYVASFFTLDYDNNSCFQYETADDSYALSIDNALIMHELDYSQVKMNGVHKFEIHTCDLQFDLDQEIDGIYSSLQNINVSIEESEPILKYLNNNNINYITNLSGDKIKIEWYSEEELSIEKIASLIFSNEE